ncbi:hypothetical protein SNE40_004490 [Patella caerulea]|uniref:Peptidase aspartic putative domain-containing protein n=1 Tax=Patella caerulea TaxID=87958 RepID=A0AAN8K334_PATCE
MKCDCKRKLICDTCRFRHPTVMHYDKWKKENKDKVSTGIQTNLITENQQRIQSHAGAGGQCTLGIIPVIVRVKHRKASCGIKTYAFMDPGSTVNFITKSLMDKLGVSGRKERRTLETMGKPLDIDTHILTGLEICSLDGSNPGELVTVFSKDEMPVSKSHIPTQADLKEWPHLHQVYLPQIEADIGMLIGNVTPGAYTPIEVVTGPDKNCPHAVKTGLGWIVWGIVRCSTDRNHEVCNFAVERDKDQMVVSKIVEAQNLEDLFRKYINTDFPEKTIDDKREPSLEDKKFEESVKKSILYSDGHYTINLPFRRKEIQLPNNSEVALARLNGIKKKFKLNQTFYEDYCKFMNDILSNGYAEEVPSS